MLHQVIDRRLSGKNKSIGNRERFLRRYRDQIKDAVRKAVGDRSISDIEQGTDITLPRRDVSEPTFNHGAGGTREMVHPGNQEYVKGDRIAKPQGGGSGSGKGASADGGGEDEFVFRISRDEFDAAGERTWAGYQKSQEATRESAAATNRDPLKMPTSHTANGMLELYDRSGDGVVDRAEFDRLRGGRCSAPWAERRE